jgi:hypothetical protein
MKRPQRHVVKLSEINEAKSDWYRARGQEGSAARILEKCKESLTLRLRSRAIFDRYFALDGPSPIIQARA